MNIKMQKVEAINYNCLGLVGVLLQLVSVLLNLVGKVKAGSK